MSYQYMNKEQFKAATKQNDTEVDPIDPGDTMTLQAMITLSEATNHRFMFEIDQSGLIATVTWVNYYQTEGGNYKIDDIRGAVVEPVRTKRVVIG